MRISHEAYFDLVSGRRRGLLPSLSRLGLLLASVPYGCAVRARNALYDLGCCEVRRVPVPVVSVGNLTVGGTGKTPCVEYIARRYREQGMRVAVLSRGYGASGGVSDEARVLGDNLPDVPHLEGPDRAALAITAVEELESEVLVLDDGFQHRRLGRELDVVLLDATNPWGYRRLLPRGLLREPSSSLRRAGAVVLTRCDQVERSVLDSLRSSVQRYAPKVPVAETTHRPVALVNRNEASLDEIRGRPVFAFCGLGNPSGFRRTLEGLGADLRAFRTFPDHHAYTRADVEELGRWAANLPPNGLVLTTQKDLVKLRLEHLGDRPLWALRVCLHFQAGHEAFTRRLDSALDALRGVPS